MKVFTTVYELILRMQITKGRLLLFAAVAAVSLLVCGVAIPRGTDDIERVDATVGFLSGFGLGLVAPVVALVMGSSVFGDLREDESLVYLWLRPASRLWVVAGGMAASMSVVVPVVVGTMTVSAWLGAGSWDVASAAAVSFMLASVAYTAIFVLAGLVLRRTLLWGMIYIFIWEFFVARGGQGAARLSINTYPASVLARLTDVELPLAERAMSTGVSVPLMVVVVALLLSARRFQTMVIA